MKNKAQQSQRKCECGFKFLPTTPYQELCRACEDSIEHDANVTMFGDDAEYLECAGLADKIGNK